MPGEDCSVCEVSADEFVNEKSMVPDAILLCFVKKDMEEFTLNGGNKKYFQPSK